MVETERWLTPAEAARRLGVTPKALRVYERAGLVTPLRTGAGWRAYGPVQLARLHQILALKRLGLSLKRVGELLTGRLDSLDAVLTLQQELLTARRFDAERGLVSLAVARAKLARGDTPTLDDFIHLTQETVMTERLKTDEDWNTAFAPLIAKHYTPEEAAVIGARKLQAFAASGYDQQSFGRVWEELFQEARALQAKDDTTSFRACELVRRWNGLMQLFIQSDAETARKTQAIWEEANADPALAPRLPIEAEAFAFVRTIADGMRARGELPPRSS